MLGKYMTGKEVSSSAKVQVGCRSGMVDIHLGKYKVQLIHVNYFTAVRQLYWLYF